MYTVEDRILHALLLLVVADGHVEADELAKVREVARDLCGASFDDERLDELAQEVRDAPEDVIDYLARIRGLLEPEERRRLLAGLRAIASADGDVADAERVELAKAAEALGLDEPT